MRIYAIRLQEVGIFREPIAVEDFSGALDVLAGPNERGKSTLLRALSTVFLDKHTAGHSDIERLRPSGGGAPLIEVDFEVQGKRYRLRKRFLAAREAVLSELDGGGALARGADAEQWLSTLLAGKAEERSRFDLLWVHQKAALAPEALEGAQGLTISRAIESEIAAVCAGQARRVRQRVTEQLGRLVTPSRQKPRGEHASAIAARDALAGRLAVARAKVDAAHGRLDQLGVLRRREAELADGAAGQARERALADARKAAEDGRAARQRLTLAVETCKAHESAHQKAAADFAACEARLAELAEVEARIGALGPTVAATQARLEAAANLVGQTRAHREALALEVAEARGRVRACEADERRRQAARRLAEVELRRAEAGAVASLLRELERELASQKVSASLLAAAEAEQRAVDDNEGRLTAAAPVVAIAYVEGGAGRIRVGLSALQDGAVLRPDKPLVLEIEGIGRLTIAPGAGADLDEIRRDRDAHRDQLAVQLAHLGASTLAEARSGLERRRELETRLIEAKASLAALAPGGLEAIEVDAIHWRKAAAGDASADLGSLAEAESRLALAEAELENAGKAAEAAAQDHARLDKELARLRMLADEGARRVDALSSQLPPSEQRRAALASRSAEVAAASAKLNEAVRAVTAWREAAPDEARLRVLEEDAGRLAEQRERIAAEIAETQRKAMRLEGELARDHEEEVIGEAEEISAELEVAQARVGQYAAETAALDLLARTLDAAAAGDRERVLKPIQDRLAPYLALVFPGSSLAMADGYAIAGLTRGGRAEQLATLSDGTQEQIAVLARLGFGRLLAETGAPAPLILDDALVYSDDERILRLFAALELGSRTHQVIVLTCRTRTFGALGGRRLKIAAWTPDEGRGRSLSN